MQCVTKKTKSLNLSARKDMELIVTREKKVHRPRSNGIWHAVEITKNQKLKP
jgi:hypothetical protein